MTDLSSKYSQGIDQPLNILETFGRAAPLVLELGFGMGDSLLQMAQEHPEYDFLGIEVHAPGVGRLLQGIEQSQVSNLRIYYGDAQVVLQQALPAQSVDRFCLFFPDPWPKKRHHKRRIIQPGFLTLLKKTLKPGALLHLATDVADYAVHMQAVLGADSNFRARNLREHPDPLVLSRPLTKFEVRGLGLGHEIWDLVYQYCEPS